MTGLFRDGRQRVVQDAKRLPFQGADDQEGSKDARFRTKPKRISPMADLDADFTDRSHDVIDSKG